MKAEKRGEKEEVYPQITQIHTDDKTQKTIFLFL
jgi:hypothetical protein